MRYWKTIILALVVLSCNPITERIDGFDIHGIDVSHYQNNILWDTIALQEVHFAFIKASEGNTLQDHYFQHNWKESKRVNIIRGAYHFFRPQVPVIDQVNNFTAQVQLEDGDMPPVLDVEVTDGVSREELRDNVKLWLQKIEAHYKIKPILYTNFNFFEENLSNGFEEYHLWIARYQRPDPNLRYNRKWKFWQYGNRGQLNGINGDVDFNVFDGNFLDLKEMCLQTLPKEEVSFSGQ